jgi:hypothetical protein
MLARIAVDIPEQLLQGESTFEALRFDAQLADERGQRLQLSRTMI